MTDNKLLFGLLDLLLFDFIGSLIFFWKRKWKWKLLSHVQLFATSMDHTVHGIFQTRILKWVAFPFSRGSSQPRDWTQISCIAGRFFTSWAPREAQEYWSGYSIPSPGDLPDPRIKRGSPALQVVFAYTGMYPLEHILFPCFLFLILNKVLFIPLWQKKTVLNKIGRYHACWLTKRQQTQSNSESNSCCSVAKLCSTLCDPMNLSTPGSPVLHSVS